MKNKLSATPREVALSLLAAVLHKRATLDDAMKLEVFNALEGRDRGFVIQLVKTVLKQNGQLNALLDSYLEKPLPENAKLARLVLLLGLAQIIILKTPAHAAVNETVELMKSTPFEHLCGLTNAVLKRASKDAKLLPVEINAPSWISKRLQQAYSPDDLAQFWRHFYEEPALDIMFKHSASTAGLTGELLPHGGMRLSDSKSITELSGFAEGEWWVQDFAAGLPALLLGDMKGKRVLDCCAAPGGKTAQLASAGAQTTALDISENRLKRLRENMQRLKLDVAVVAGDALTWQPKELFDAVLLDAPCSALGTARRNPEILHHRLPADVERLTVLQKKLLERAHAFLKPGGKLVYAVCSPFPEEGEAQIEAILKTGLYELQETVLSDFQAKYGLGKAKFGLHTLATKGNLACDGFYMTYLKKI